MDSSSSEAEFSSSDILLFSSGTAAIQKKQVARFPVVLELSSSQYVGKERMGFGICRKKADNTDGFGGNIRVLAQPLPRCRSRLEREAAGKGLGLVLVRYVPG